MRQDLQNSTLERMTWQNEVKRIDSLYPFLGDGTRCAA